MVTSEIVEPQDTGALRLETDTQYDAFGNKHVTNVTGLAATPAGLASQSRPTNATYDAHGRFTSPDDVIPDVYNGQDFNRYTYVDNNPLSYANRFEPGSAHYWRAFYRMGRATRSSRLQIAIQSRCIFSASISSKTGSGAKRDGSSRIGAIGPCSLALARQHNT